MYVCYQSILVVGISLRMGLYSHKTQAHTLILCRYFGTLVSGLKYFFGPLVFNFSALSFWCSDPDLFSPIKFHLNFYVLNIMPLNTLVML